MEYLSHHVKKSEYFEKGTENERVNNHLDVLATKICLGAGWYAAWGVNLWKTLKNTGGMGEKGRAHRGHCG